MSPSIASLAFAAFVVCLWPGQVDGGQERWPAWRGGERQGRSASDEAPLHWSPSENIRWRTRIPGRGHSSPVVADGKIFVTTAYLAPRYAWARGRIRYLQWLLTSFLAFLAMRCIVLSLRETTAGLLRVGSTLAFALLVILFGAAVVFGRNALDFDRCIIRSWLGSSLLVSLAFLLSEFRSDWTAERRLVRAVAMSAFAVLVVVASPAKDHTLGRGLLSLQVLTVLGVAAIPVILGWAAVLANAKRTPEPSRTPVPAVVFLGIGGLLPSIIAAVPIISHRANYAHLVNMASVEAPLLGVIAFAALAALWIGVVALVLLSPPWRRIDPMKWSRRFLGQLLVITSGVVCVGAISWGLLRAVIDRSQFLGYQLANPRIEPELGWWSPAVLGLPAMLGLVAATREWGAIGRSGIRSPGFGLVAMVIASVAFLDNNYLAPIQTMTRAVVCLDEKSGKILWIRTGLEGREGQLHRMNSPATPTAFVSRDRVYAYFGSAGVMCVDFEGRLLWTNDKVTFRSVYGVGASPVLAEDVLVILNGMPKSPHVVALDAESGRVVWKREIRKTTHNELAGIRRSPILLRVRGRTSVLVWGFDDLDAYDPHSGELVWSYPLGGGGGDMVATPIYDDQKLYLMGAQKSYALEISRLGEEEPPIVWESAVRGPNCSSPVLVKDRLLFVSDRGIASWVDAESGRRIGRTRLPGDYYASPTVVGHHVYFTSSDGVTTVMAANRGFETIAENDLSVPIMASFAPVDGRIIVRTADDVLTISTKF